MYSQLREPDEAIAKIFFVVVLTNSCFDNGWMGLCLMTCSEILVTSLATFWKTLSGCGPYIQFLVLAV
jgi:hypothetical protein